MHECTGLTKYINKKCRGHIATLHSKLIYSTYMFIGDLIVLGLHYGVRAAELAEYLGQFGELTLCKVR